MKDRKAMFQNAATIKNSMVDLKQNIKIETPTTTSPLAEEPIVEEPIISTELVIEEQPIVEESTIIEPIEEIKVNEPILIKKKKYDEQ